MGRPLSLLGHNSYVIGVSLQSDMGRTVSPLVTYSQSVGNVLSVRWYRTPVLLKKKIHNEGRGERLKLNQDSSIDLSSCQVVWNGILLIGNVCYPIVGIDIGDA